MASTFTPTVITSNSGANNVFTNIPLANSATTTIQNISTFANGEGGVLTGVIKIDATTDYVFGFEISFTKDTAGVINHSVRYFAGDIPTLALFTIGVSGQDIQITLGTHAGFVNSSARFQMMASAASPGVQVSARNVTGDTTGTAPGAGLIGQIIVATNTANGNGGTNLTTGTNYNLASLPLTAGSWLIVGAPNVGIFENHANAINAGVYDATIGISTTITAGYENFARLTLPSWGNSTDSYFSSAAINMVVNISAPTTYYVNGILNARGTTNLGAGWVRFAVIPTNGPVYAIRIA